ncbi:unnamed protein product [Pedinophyceae sp. YPF-701]|nr:unnamed protein product [Pedinophyceae sp. YPF-701]
MSKAALKRICKEAGGFSTPSLNDKLYGNYKGFTAIANLEEYTGLKAVFLEGNALDSLEGLPALPELKCLYAQQNCIHDISGLEGCPLLAHIDLSRNRIKVVENLDHLEQLATLQLAGNDLTDKASIAHLARCSAVETLDLSDNRIDDPAALEVLQSMKQLRCLYLKGNPIVSATRNYRKAVIAALPNLSYLDDRPVFDLERTTAEAFAEGGIEAEREARRAFKAAEDERHKQNMQHMWDIREAAWKKRREAMGQDPDAPGDPAFDDLDDTEWTEPEEPPELVAARRKLAAYTARPGEEEPPELTAERTRLAAEGRAVVDAQWSALAPGDENARRTEGAAGVGRDDQGSGETSPSSGPREGVKAEASDLPDLEPLSVQPSEARAAAGGDALDGLD